MKNGDCGSNRNQELDGYQPGRDFNFEMGANEPGNKWLDPFHVGVYFTEVVVLHHRQRTTTPDKLGNTGD